MYTAERMWAVWSEKSRFKTRLCNAQGVPYLESGKEAISDMFLQVHLTRAQQVCQVLLPRIYR